MCGKECIHPNRLTSTNLTLRRVITHHRHWPSIDPDDDIAIKFHVDNLSSAHVYLRLKPGESWTSIPQTLLEDCAQLTKANSIDGR